MGNEGLGQQNDLIDTLAYHRQQYNQAQQEQQRSREPVNSPFEHQRLQAQDYSRGFTIDPAAGRNNNASAMDNPLEYLREAIARTREQVASSSTAAPSKQPKRKSSKQQLAELGEMLK